MRLFMLYSLTYKMVYNHPIFWTWNTRLMFLVDACEILKMIMRDNKNNSILNVINTIGVLLFDKKWKDTIDQGWYKSMTKSTYTDDLYGLLKIIRDTNNHILEVEKEEWDRKAMENHISELYPTLAMWVYEALETYFSENRLLRVYFESSTVVGNWRWESR